MARILVALTGKSKKVIPFVVGKKVCSLKKTAQVNFMEQQCWLKKRNVLSWKDIERLAKGES